MGSWLGPVLVFAAARVVSTVLMLWLGPDHAAQPPYSETERIRGLGDGPLDMMRFWDGRWYRQIATDGYPGALPREDGEVIQNPWAFYPLYPAIVATVMRMGLPFEVAALVVSLVVGAAAMVILYRMLLPGTGRFTALLTVAAVSAGPTGALFQLGYTEGLAILLFLGALWSLRRKRYAVAGVLSLALALTRPITPALALVMAVLWVLRWRRTAEPFPVAQRLKHGVLAVGTAAAFAIWPLTCGLVTGELDGYRLTQAAWSNEAEVLSTWLGTALGDPIALLLVAFFLGGASWLAIRRGAAGWGDDLRAWVIVYPLFILGVSGPSTSVFRYLTLTVLPAWPFPDISTRIRSTPARVVVILGVMTVGTVLQYYWLRYVFLSFRFTP